MNRSKKTNEADLEKKRGVFFYIGFAAALSFVMIALEWTSVEYGGNKAYGEIPMTDIMEEDEIPVVRIERPKVEPPKDNTRFIIAPNPEPEPDPDPDPDPEPDPEPFLVEIGDPFGSEEPDPEPEPDLDPQVIVEIMPHFADCENVVDRDAQQVCTERRIIEWVQDHVKYPSHLRDAGIQGKVFASFVIDKQGGITSVNILRTPHKDFNGTVTQAINSIPEMTPGSQQGRKASVIMTIPVHFKLN